VFGVTTAPPRAYRGAFVLNIDGAITNDCALTPGVFGAERHGVCLYLEPRCRNCGHGVVKGSPVTILRIHHDPDMETATVRIGAGADAIVVDRANWNDLQQVIVPATPRHD
jgi:hypothetical protein